MKLPVDRDRTELATASLLGRADLRALLFLLAAPLAVFPFDFVSKALLDGGDDVLANIPELVHSGEELLHGEIFWTPRLWMGHPLLAEPEFETFYFPKLLLLVGSPVVVYAAYLVLHYLAAELGAYLYLKSLGIGRLGASFGALAYAYAGFMLGHRAHTMYVCAGAWTPFVLLLIDRATERGGRWRYLGAALAFAMVPFCGAVQLTVYLISTILMVAGARWVFERDSRPFVGAVACLVPGVLISAVQLVPSFDYARQLATDMRADYALDVMHSFHPALLPTLALPIPPFDAELYSRAGVAVVCAAALAFAGIRSAPPRIRAWGVVAVVALLLMFGRYVPPRAHLLHGLPVVGVLRGPARHNFELGLALSVLGAYGVEVARRAGAGPVRRWVASGIVFAGLSYGAVRLAAGGRIGPQAQNLMAGVTARGSVVAALCFVVWVFASWRRSAPRSRALWILVAALPALEAGWAMRVESWSNRSLLDLVESARTALPQSGQFVRLLSVSVLRASADDLAGNSVLFHPGVESLQGYSSIAYASAREVLDLDMHGQPVEYESLAFSTLPSVFGVTHVVLPNVACGEARASLGPDDTCVRPGASSANPPAFALVEGERGCTLLTTDATYRYRLDVEAKAPATEPRGARFRFYAGPDWQWSRFGIDIPGSAIGPVKARTSGAVHLGDAEMWGGLLLENDRETPAEFSAAGLYVERDVTVGSLEPRWASSHAERAEAVGMLFRLNPQGDLARVESRVFWPNDARDSDGRAVLEVEARAPSGSAQDLVVDLYSDSGYDPDEAQFVVPAHELEPSWRVLRNEIRAGGAPESFLLRAFTSGAYPIELRTVRLARRVDERACPFPVSINRALPHARVEDGKVTIDGRRYTGGAVHLPVRAFDVVLDAEAPALVPGPGSVYFGLSAGSRYEPPRAWSVGLDAFEHRARVHHVAVVPPDIRDPRLFARVSGARELQIHELSASDACGLRGYRNPRPLANGLSLYENPSSTDRAYAVGSVIRVGDLRGVRQALLDFGAADLGEKAVVTGTLPPNLRKGTVEHAEFGRRQNDVVVQSDGGPTLLVVNERFDPDWRATIDGAPAAILPVNGLVRGVVVPEGSHRVHFEYRIPRSFWLGLGLAIAGVLGALFVAPIARRSKRQNSV